ncbi:hypothetical protein G3580_00255 [Nitrogeniibacter mangrovi]|uniref:Uncharacterized protein n=1 Tax=Nitrogeniibacter mangrovi TaxID=2016596 RepID=A0A6C1AXW1_9RHOO|nr:hypothetical protein [Nitrogeniibacter mangrovi]QID16192.1 hypothetical protein G3580_00255 [Nitrogeniibacter mangrovi]
MARPLLRFVGLLIVVAAAGVLLNPSPDKHRDAIRKDVAERSQVANLLQLGTITAFFSEYHSFGVGSYTTVNGKVVSIGAFGGVYVRENAARVDPAP